MHGVPGTTTMRFCVSVSAMITDISEHQPTSKTVALTSCNVIRSNKTHRLGTERALMIVQMC